MLDATKAPALSTKFGFSGTLDGRLVKYLPQAGERESIVQFLEGSARIDSDPEARMLADAAAIRAGRMPISPRYAVRSR